MTVKEHYKLHNNRKNIKPYIKLVILIALTFTIFSTFARYSSISNGSAIIHLAKWSIKVNGQTITNENNSVSVSLLNKKDNTSNIDMDSDDECYFNIIMDPTETEVAVNTAPINIAEANVALSSKIYIKPAPIPRGTKTPVRATTNPALPEAFNSSKFVSIPAENIITITPNSASLDNNSDGIKQN